MGWTAGIDDLSELSDHSRRRLEALTPMSVPTDTVLFRPGDTVQGYVVVLLHCRGGPRGHQHLPAPGSVGDARGLVDRHGDVVVVLR